MKRVRVLECILVAAVVSSSVAVWAQTQPAAATNERAAELAARVETAEKELEAVKQRKGKADELVTAQLAIGRLLADAGEFDRARQEYEKAFQYPAADQTHMRAYIQMCIADSYLAEKKYLEAEEAYTKALGIGPGGWHKDHCETNLKKARELIGDPAKRLALRIEKAKKEMEAVKQRKGKADELVTAQLAIGRLLAEAGEFDKARQEYEKAFQYPAADQTHMRAYIQMCIADSYLAEKKYLEAEEAYTKALGIGPGGWHKDHCETNLKKARELIGDPAKRLALRIEKAKKELEAVKQRKGKADELVTAQLAIGRLLAEAGEFDKARQEYEKAFQYPAADQTYLRAQIQMTIADSYVAENKYPEPGPADITLVVPDNPLSIPDTVAGNADGYGYRAGLTQVEAAKRLRRLIGRAVGVWPRIVPAAQTPKIGLRIYVGYGPHLKGVVEPPTQPEGLRIVERNGDAYLLGEIAPDGLNNWPGVRDRGVMYAVETFAEQVMGYRFLISTLDDAEMFELGTVIPKLNALTIAPGLRIDEAPVFPHRHFGRRHDGYRLALGMAEAGKGYYAFMGAREGSATAFYCNHSYNEKGWAQTYAKEHPEMFIPLVPDKVDADHAKAMGTQIQPDFLDYTEPLVLEKHLEHLDTFFKTGGNPGQVFYRFPTRTHIMEEPPDHIALSERYNERSRALWNPKPDDWGTFSNIWFDYLRRLSPEVKKRWPHMRISTLAYYRHYGVPTFEVPDNIDVMIAIMRSTMQCKEPYVFDKNLAHVKKWFDHLGKDRSRLYLWEYGCWPTEQGATGPLLCPFAMQKWLQAVRPYVMGAAVEWYDPPEYFLMPRIWTRLLWNPDLDVAAEIADVCGRFHGPAGDTMTAFYRRLIERYEMRWENPGLLWDQTYADPGLYYGQSLPPAEILRLATLLEKARVDVGLPAVLETQVQHGTAVYLFNAQAAEAPVRISLTALGHEVVHPAVGWDGGRMVWRGTLKPGERLDIAGAGQARVTAADGAVREAGGELEGAAPALAAGKADVFNFWHAGADRSVRFQAALRYGPDGETTAKPAEMGVYARRLAWVRDPFVVFQPINLSRHQRGVFAEAHVVHQRLGQAPSCKAVEAGALPAGMDDPLWANVPAVELVRGREGGTASCDRIGLAADRRTRVQFVQSREGLAARIAAEGAPAEKEKLVLRLNDKALEFAIAAKPAAGAALRQIKIDKDGWRGLAVVGWGEIGVAVDALPAGISMQVVRESGPDGYVWSPAVGFPWPNGGAQGPGKLQLVDPAKVLAMRMEKAVKDLEAVKRKKGTAEELVNAQLAIGRLLADAGEFDRARQECQKAFQYPAADQTHMRAYIQMRIADSYLEEKKYLEAEDAYAKALSIGPGGWHKDHCETNLKKARELAGGPAKLLAMRMDKAVKELEAVKEKKGAAWELANAQLAIGRLLADAGEFDRARQEYEKAFQYPAADQTHLRAYIQMRIADSYLEEKKYPEAEAAYAKALGIGPGGWHKDHCETNLKKARELAGGKQP